MERITRVARIVRMAQAARDALSQSGSGSAESAPAAEMSQLADAIAADKGRAEHTAEKAERKADRLRDALNGVFEDLKVLIRMIKAWSRKEYSDAPWKSIGMAVFALVYFLSPFDAIPDFLAAVGLLDDVMVIRQVVESIRSDLTRFRSWEANAQIRDMETQ